MVAESEDLIQAPSNVRRLRLAAATLDEQAGRHGEALERIALLLDELPEGATTQRRDLRARAAVVRERQGGGAAGYAAANAASSAVTAGANGLPLVFALRQVVPNPSRGDAVVPYDLPEPARVRVEVFDVLGRRVATLVDADEDAGEHRVLFDTKAFAAGIYLIRATMRPRTSNVRRFTQSVTAIR
jgi:hypothetical protein